jgi:hypothetical protein
VPIDYIFYISYSKFYYALLSLKKVMILFFNVTIYIKFELLDY